MKKIIVPSDFTSVADVAIRYACELGKVIESEVFLLHIVKHASEIPHAEERLRAQALSFKEKHGFHMQWIARDGNIFDDIPQVASEEEAELVVMGTHGLRGMQFIVGSHALRVISESKVPMIIVQESTTKHAQVHKLLVPLDLHKETKQKLDIAADIAKRFRSEVHIISPKESDEYLHNRLERNIAYAEGFFEEKGIPYKSTFTESGSSGFVKDLMTYANYAEVDLICILNNSDENLIHAFGADSEQKLITNPSGIPVMVINPKHALIDSRTIFAQ